MREPDRSDQDADGAVHEAIAVLTCWTDDDLPTGTRVAAGALDRDPIAFLDALGGLVTVITDVCAEAQVDVRAIVRDVALGVAQAAVDADRDRRGGTA